MGLGQHLISVVVISFLIPLFWFFGLHGANILEAVMSPVYGTLGLQNIQLFSEGIRTVGSGANELAVWVRGSWDAYVFLGGSGATLPLIAAFLWFSKVKEHKEIAKLGTAPGIFMINEPILFGIPVVLNPIFLVPFLLVQPVLTVIAYLATTAGIAGPIVNSVPWTTPPILNAYLATNGSLGATLVAAVNLVVAFFIYMPFVVVANKQAEKLAKKSDIAA
jgi:PTS system cellobiose-specific IIC component